MLCFVLTLCNLNPYALPCCRKIFVWSWERDGPAPGAPLRAATLTGSRGRPDSTENGVSWLPSEFGRLLATELMISVLETFPCLSCILLVGNDLLSQSVIPNFTFLYYFSRKFTFSLIETLCRSGN